MLRGLVRIMLCAYGAGIRRENTVQKHASHKTIAVEQAGNTCKFARGVWNRASDRILAPGGGGRGNGPQAAAARSPTGYGYSRSRGLADALLRSRRIQLAPTQSRILGLASRLATQLREGAYGAGR